MNLIFLIAFKLAKTQIHVFLDFWSLQKIKSMFYELVKGPSINHVTGGGWGFWSKRHESVTRGGGGSQIFSNPQRVILTFLNSEFWIFPMNLVALAEEFQNQIFFIAQGTYPEFWVDFLSYIDTCIAEMTLNLCNNFSLLSRRAQRQSRRL